MEEDTVAVPIEKIEITLIKANIELLQRVNKLIELLEKQNENK